MFFWIREIAGWALVILALAMFWIGLSYLTAIQEPKIIESSIINIAAVAILRAGLMLIRISTTSRVAIQLTKPSKVDTSSER